jgi:hypothetical protein
MYTVTQLLEDLTLHDGTVHSMTVTWDGVMTLALDLDEVWNPDASTSIVGIRLPSVFEVVNYKMDRLNTVDSVQAIPAPDYDRSFVCIDKEPAAEVVMVDFNFVAGGRLTLVCTNRVELLEEQPNSAMHPDGGCAAAGDRPNR